MSDPTLERLCNRAADRAVEKFAANPVHPPSPWMTTQEYCDYRGGGFTVRAAETERLEKRGPPWSYVHKRLVRYHRGDVDAWFRSHMIFPGGEQ